MIAATPQRALIVTNTHLTPTPSVMNPPEVGCNENKKGKEPKQSQTADWANDGSLRKGVSDQKRIDIL